MHHADLQHKDQTLQTKLEEIFQLRRTRSKINWDRTQYLKLLEKFGNPQNELPPVIHVAGTNGKGSIIAMLRTILTAAGLRVHSYTSPHLIQVNERIHLAGQPIPDSHLEELIDQALKLNQDMPLSFFEITTALAFRAFADTPADILLLEVGMGGELDCTNAIKKPLCSIINRISMDHTDFLGDNIVDITRAKAGIMKSGTACIVGYQGKNKYTKDILETLKAHAAQTRSALSIYGEDWSVEKKEDLIRFTQNGIEKLYPVPNMIGKHQIYNAGVVLAALSTIKNAFDIPYDAICQGLKTVSWPGRLQKIPTQAFKITDKTEIWLDCGHNDSASEAMAEQIIQWQADDTKDTHLIMGMLDTKNPKLFLEPLLDHIHALHIIPISSDPNTLTKEQIIKSIPQKNVRAFEHENVIDAILSISEEPNTRIIVNGSVYLAGEILQKIDHNPTLND